MKPCITCQKPFHSQRKDSRFCSNKCRLKHFRDQKNISKVKLSKISVSPINETDKKIETDNETIIETDTTFIPNWKRLGLNSKDEAIAFSLKALEKNSKQIMKHSLKVEKETQPIYFYVKGRTFILGERGFLKK